MNRKISGYVLGAVALALLGAACLAGAVFDRHVARLQRNITTLKFEEPDPTLESAERYLEYASYIPGIGSGALNDLRARKAAMLYWRRQYDRLAPPDADPFRGIAPDNVELQLIVANAVYRRGRARAKDKRTALEAIDAAANAYLTVLKNTDRQEAAAYNYEYLARLREEVDKGRAPVEETEGAQDGPGGKRGNVPPTDAGQRKLKVIIPLDPGEMDQATDPGKGAQIKRKG
jgi:hypothetical protein